MQNDNVAKLLLTFEARDYGKLDLNRNPFPAIALCNYNVENKFFIQSMLCEMKRLRERLKKIWEKKRVANVFLTGPTGTGKSTFLFNFCRWVNEFRRDTYAVYTTYPPSWGICKLYRCSLRWIGRKNFANAYNHIRSLKTNVKKTFLALNFLKKTNDLKVDPCMAFEKLMRIGSSKVMSEIISSVINMIVLHKKIDYVIFSIDNIENVWSYIGTYQRLVFLAFVNTILSSVKKHCVTIMPLPRDRFFERWISYHLPVSSKYLDLKNEYIFDLDLQGEEYCIEVIKTYLKQAHDSNVIGELHPFTETALRKVILNNTGIISNILNDAFNLIEISVKKGSVIGNETVAEYYKPGKFSLLELSLKCPATNYKHGHYWISKEYDYEKRIWRRTCKLCGITEESTITGYRKFYNKDGKLIGEIQSIRR